MAISRDSLIILITIVIFAIVNCAFSGKSCNNELGVHYLII